MNSLRSAGWKGALVGLLLTGGCGQGAGEAPAQATARNQEPPPLQVEFVRAQSLEVPDEIQTTGSLLPAERATLSNQVEGVILSLEKDVGDPVAEGEMLLRLDATQLRLRLEQAEADLQEALARLGASDPEHLPALEETARVEQAQALLVEAERRYLRGKQLLEKGAISQAQMDELETALEVARNGHRMALEEARYQLAVVRSRQAAVALAREDLENARVFSPFEGFVERRLVSVGEFLRQNTPCFVLVKAQPLKLEGEIPEEQAARLKPGLEVRIKVDAFPAREFSGRLTRLSPSVNEQTRTLRFEAQISETGGLLKPGFFARLRVVFGKRRAVVVPDRALLALAGARKAFVRVGDRVEERPVQVGRSWGDQVEILEGVAEGEWLAASRLAELSDGTRVR